VRDEPCAGRGIDTPGSFWLYPLSMGIDKPSNQREPVDETVRLMALGL
jgi:hypothetical protein